MENTDIFSYIKTQETAWKTDQVALTRSKSWNMYEHLERCFNVANGWFHQGQNDGLRPYNDIVTPIIDVAFRSEGFDVKDIVPYVDDVDQAYKSFIIKKYHPDWARKHLLDTFIDEVVESSIIYDLVLVKNVNDVRPEVVDLQTLAFCDQTDIMAGPICIRHQYTPAELVEKKGKWDSDKIDQAILMSLYEKKSDLANEQIIKTPSKYIEVYELRGNLPEYWLDEEGERFKYTPQTHIVCYYTGDDGLRNGITLYKGKDKPLNKVFKALKIDQVRSKGRACGRSVVERLFEPQVWNNYAGIKLKEMLDSAVNLLQTESQEVTNQKLKGLTNFTVLKHEMGKPLSRVDMQLQNVPTLQGYQAKTEQDARILGSASDPALGLSPTSGTPLGTTQLITQQGLGIHGYRQGKIATFFSDELYADWILEWMIKDMNKGKKFSEDLTLEEVEEIVDKVVNSELEKKIKELMLSGIPIYAEDKLAMAEMLREDFMKGGQRRFLEALENELEDVPTKVFVNIAGKQRNMVDNANKLSNIMRFVTSAPGAIQQIPGLGKLFNELIEESGYSPVDFTQITKPPTQPMQPQVSPLQNNAQPVQ